MAENNNQTTSRFSRKQWIGAVVAVVVVIAIALFASKPTSAPTAPETVIPAGGETSGSSDTADDSKNTLSFAQMQKIYMGRTVTISNSCKVSPEEQKQKKGTMVLLSNASDTTKTIGFAGETYTISPLHYRTVKLEADARGARYLVTCDGIPTQSAVTVEL